MSLNELFDFVALFRALDPGTDPRWLFGASTALTVPRYYAPFGGLSGERRERLDRLSADSYGSVSLSNVAAANPAYPIERLFAITDGRYELCQKAVLLHNPALDSDRVSRLSVHARRQVSSLLEDWAREAMEPIMKRNKRAKIDELVCDTFSDAHGLTKHSAAYACQDPVGTVKRLERLFPAFGFVGLAQSQGQSTKDRVAFSLARFLSIESINSNFQQASLNDFDNIITVLPEAFSLSKEDLGAMRLLVQLVVTARRITRMPLRYHPLSYALEITP